MKNMKFKDVSNKLIQSDIEDAKILISDMKKTFELALNNENARDAKWNLRVINSHIVELKERIDDMINFIES